MNGQEERMARRPFSSIPDIEAYYPSVSADTAQNRIFRTLDRGEGIALLFGDAGLGKTLALRLLTGKFELNAPVLLFSNARIASRRSFYLDLLFQLRCDFTSSDEDELRVRFFEHLRHNEYPYYVFLFDNADTLPLSVFEEVRSLLDIESRGGPRFRAAFAGTSRFEERLNAPRFARISQRIISRSWLEPFTRDETLGYIERQLKRAAEEYNGLTFSTDAAKQVHKLADGVPRVINQICDLALYLHEGNESVISEKTVRKAWGLLQQIPDEEEPSDAERTFRSPSTPVSSIGGPESSPVVEFGELDATPDDAPAFAPIRMKDADDSPVSDSVVEFGSLEDEAVNPSAEPIDETAEHADEHREENVIHLVPKRTLSEDEDVFSSSQEDTYDGVADESLSIDDHSIQWHSETGRNLGEEHARYEGDAEPWDDEEELVDESGTDLTYDSMIREKLLKDFPEGNPAESTVQKQTVPPCAGDRTGEEEFGGDSDRCMEELRLMEMEVAQAGNVICKIRKMQTGLESFQNTEEDSVRSASVPEEDESAPAKKRSFHNVFEKLYPKEDRDK